MSSVGGNNKAGPSNEYEQRRLENIEKNKKRMADLNIRELVNTMEQRGQRRKTSKRKQSTSIPTCNPPNLRPRPQRNIAQHEEEVAVADLQPDGDFLGDNVEDNLNDGTNIADTIVGGEPLGRQYCELIVTSVLKRDAILPRPYGSMDTMANAHLRTIAWPYKKLKIMSKTSTPGHVGR